jgi:4,5:9,10-diseco-3-hydroxy-5,9,17-trioxoandrosta-1(10),2-diene-4-oate hydrolase
MSTFSIPEGKYVDIGNVAGHPQRVHYHEQGSGDPVIFLHGAGTGRMLRAVRASHE